MLLPLCTLRTGSVESNVVTLRESYQTLVKIFGEESEDGNGKMKRSQKTRVGGVGAKKTLWLFGSTVGTFKRCKAQRPYFFRKEMPLSHQSPRPMKQADSEHRTPEGGKRKVLL